MLYLKINEKMSTTKTTRKKKETRMSQNWLDWTMKTNDDDILSPRSAVVNGEMQRRRIITTRGGAQLDMI